MLKKKGRKTVKLYDNDEYRETFMELVYDLLRSDGTNDRANLIIDAFDNVPEVEAEILPPNDPLTPEQLREMEGPVWCRVDDCSWIPEGGYWCLCDHGTILAPNGNKFDCESIPDWIFYRRKPEEGSN